MFFEAYVRHLDTSHVDSKLKLTVFHNRSECNLHLLIIILSFILLCHFRTWRCSSTYSCHFAVALGTGVHSPALEKETVRIEGYTSVIGLFKIW